MDTLDHKIVREYFERIAPTVPAEERPASLLITHILHDRPFFVEACARVSNIRSLIPKPKSEDKITSSWLQHKYHLDRPGRAQLADGKALAKFVSKRIGNAKVVLIDIGGYFAPSLPHLSKLLGPQLLGVIEDTENGAQKYEKLTEATCPIIQVARSPLKDPEDFLIGQSIVFSIESLLREQGDILHGRTACIIGYGKIGSSIANLLHDRRVNVVVVDTNPMRSVIASSHGFRVSQNKRSALSGAGLVVGATGNLSMTSDDFQVLDRGAYVATVTSSDDEIDLGNIVESYHWTQVTDFLTRYQRGDHYFYILNRGQAVNFIHGAAVGPYIYLVQGEIVASVGRLVRGGLEPGVQENEPRLRNRIAEEWQRCFLSSKGPAA